MSLSFGTSGLRGLVSDLDDAAVARWMRAFLVACPPPGRLWVGGDLRPSTPRIMAQVLATARAAGVDTVACGALPTPALALAARGESAVMVTGSHIPADRNGLKFYTPAGEIAKPDEAAIAQAFAAGAAPAAGQGGLRSHDASAAYARRYVQAYGPALTGLRIGVYQHSSVARDIMGAVVTALGAEAVPLERSETFIPVDTEAVDPQTRAMLADWATQHRLDAVISTDGDADRPMLAGGDGAVIAGDVLGVLTARALGADQVVTPVSSNSMVRALFPGARLTRIGSPYVIAGMQQVLAQDPATRVVGFEANGGFLLGFAARGPAGGLAPLMTRDSLLPMIAPLAQARAAGDTVAGLVARLPARVTAADRLQGIDPAAAQRFLAGLQDAAARAAFLAPLGREQALDQTDGMRVQLAGGAVIHLRPSGNAPEFRVYTEADSAGAAQAMLDAALRRVRAALA